MSKPSNVNPAEPGSERPTDDLPSLSIRRPILVLVANLLIALAGVAAFLAVEVRELPNVDYPFVSVWGVYPGASPETMDAEVTSLLEGAVARVSGVKNIQSSSEENNFRMFLEFVPGVDLNSIASEVREAVSRVRQDLPEDVEQITVIKADPDASPIMNVVAVSETLDAVALTERVEKDIVPELIAVEGVADVAVYGGRNRALRVVIDPLALAKQGLDVSDLADALRNAPFDVPTGSFKSEDKELLVRADASAITEQSLKDIIIEGDTRVADVAQVFYAPMDASSLMRLNGEQVVGMGIIRQAQSNTLEISNGITRALEPLNQRFDDINLLVSEDNAIFIRGAVREVVTSLMLTVLIVVATIWLFIGSFRVTLIPSVAIPVALVGTLAAIWALGFSINILTLLALVLATGLVVDDAIVVLENIQRRRHQGLGARAAAVLGTRQVFFAVVATTAVLVSVFVPIALLPSAAGRLFREFGFVLAVAVAISSFVALSLVPAAAARIAPEKPAPHPVRDRLHWLGNTLARLYDRLLARTLRHGWIAMGVAFGVAVLAGILYQQLPQKLVPDEDRGVIYIDGSGPDGVGLEYTERQVNAMEDAARPVLESGEARLMFSVVGQWDPNRGRVVLPLIPWEQRERSQQEIMAELEPRLRQIPGAFTRVGGSNSLNIRGGGGGRIEVALTGPSYERIYAAAQDYAQRVDERYPHISQPDINYQPSQPQLAVQIDRRRASELGVPLESIATTLRAMVGGFELVDLNVDDQTVPIVLESAVGRISSPKDLVNLYVRNNQDQLVPLSSLVSLSEQNVAAELDRHAQRRAIEIDFNLEPGVPLADVVADLRSVAHESLPQGIGIIFQGEAQTLNETSREVTLTYLIALLVVFLVLCAQFESFISALIIMVTVPFGLAAAVLAIFMTGISINIYSQIGLVMLIGLMAKNGILLVEFADQLRDRGASVLEAVSTAASVRLRPIVMTMISTVLGGLPLILSDGAGAEARSSIGWVIFGGLGLAALFTLFLTPVVYLGLARFAKPRVAEAQRLSSELQQATEIPDKGRGWQST